MYRYLFHSHIHDCLLDLRHLHSFGGWKNSLFGDHAMHGKEGVNFYTKLKTITSRWPENINEGAEFVMPVN